MQIIRETTSDEITQRYRADEILQEKKHKHLPK